MPKVSNVVITINGRHQRFDVYYNAKNRFFVKDFPAEIIRMAGDNVFATRNGYDTEMSLKEALEGVVNKYHQAMKTSRKVIAYRFGASTEILMKKIGEGHFHNFKDWVPDSQQHSNSMDGYSLSLEYNVYMEVNDNGLHYFNINEDGEMGWEAHISQSKWSIIPWTEQREKALQQICDSMEVLVKRIGSVLWNAEQTITLLESGIKLLPE